MKKQILLKKWLSRWSAIKSAHQSCCRDCLVALPPAVVERVVAALDDSVATPLKLSSGSAARTCGSAVGLLGSPPQDTHAVCSSLANSRDSPR